MGTPCNGSKWKLEGGKWQKGTLDFEGVSDRWLRNQHHTELFLLSPKDTLQRLCLYRLLKSVRFKLSVGEILDAHNATIRPSFSVKGSRRNHVLVSCLFIKINIVSPDNSYTRKRARKNKWKSVVTELDVSTDSSFGDMRVLVIEEVVKTPVGPQYWTHIISPIPLGKEGLSTTLSFLLYKGLLGKHIFGVRKTQYFGHIFVEQLFGMYNKMNDQTSNTYFYINKSFFLNFYSFLKKVFLQVMLSLLDSPLWAMKNLASTNFVQMLNKQ